MRVENYQTLEDMWVNSYQTFTGVVLPKVEEPGAENNIYFEIG